jgi:protein phosphatase
MWMAADTDVGRDRKNNQDVFHTGSLTDGAYIVVCDGMGGEQGGGVASQIAAKTFSSVVEASFMPAMGEMSVRRVLQSAAQTANAAVRDAAVADIELARMGTTLVAVIVLYGAAHFAHVGDSRAYLLRDGYLTQLTVDHTVVQMLIDRGDISLQDADKHPQRHYITRAVGVADKVRADVFSIDLEPDDVLLLCSDGLYNFMSHEELCALTREGAAQRSVRELIARANKIGGGDNITAALISPGGEE